MGDFSGFQLADGLIGDFESALAHLAHTGERSEAEVEAVLGGEGRATDALEHLLDARSLSAREHHQEVGGVGGELLEAMVYRRRQVRVVVRDERRQLTIVDGD